MQELDGNMIRVREDREDTDTQRSRSSDTFRGRPNVPSRGIKVVCCLHISCAPPFGEQGG